jgi:hypothetical protein
VHGVADMLIVPAGFGAKPLSCMKRPILDVRCVRKRVQSGTQPDILEWGLWRRGTYGMTVIARFLETSTERIPTVGEGVVMWLAG